VEHATLEELVERASGWRNSDMLMLQVAWHPSGRRTLEERDGNHGLFRDPKPSSPLFANLNAAEFYRAVAQRLGELGKEGKPFFYEDSDPSDEITHPLSN
jgi:hypothetical protein